MQAPPEALVREIGRRVERMAERTKAEESYLPHPIAVAMAEAVRGGSLTDGDGTFGAMEHHYQVHMSKANGHFALLDVVNLRTGKVLPPAAVLRMLHVHDLLADYPGPDVGRKVAEGVVSGVLGVDDASSSRLLARAGLGGDAVPKDALLALVEALPA